MVEETIEVGDIIKHRYQENAPMQLIVKLTDKSDIVWVHDPERGYIKTFTFNHDIVKKNDDKSISEAIERATSEEFANSPWR